MENLYSPEARSNGLLSLLWRHKGKLLLTLLVGLGLTVAYVGLATRKFESNAKLFVQLGRESATLDPTATTGQLVGVADSRESEVLAVEELLGSRLMAEQAVDHFGPEKILEKDPKRPGLQLSKRLAFLEPYNLNPLRVYSLRDKAIESFLENLRVGAINKTSVLTVRYVSENPQLAHDVLTYLLTEACDEHLRMHRTKGSQQFFAEQTALLKSNLAKLEERYRDLKNQTGLASLESQREIELQLIGSLQADLKRALAERDGVDAELRERRDQLKEQPQFVVSERTTGQPQSTGQSLREKIFDLEVREQELASKYTDENPLLIQLRSQLAEARKIASKEKASSEVKSSVSETYKATQLAVQEREAEQVAINARIAALETQIAASESSMKKINDSEVELKRLEREIELTRTNYTKYAENLEQARINQELEAAKITSLTLMQPPSYSETPVSPRPLVALAVGLALSLICGLGLAVLADGRARPTVAAAQPAPVQSTIVIEHAPPADTDGETDAGSRTHRGKLVPAKPR